jgi:nucleotide-binding universal stress UspA family protein
VLRRILIGLGGMAGSRSALDLGIHWAKLHSAQLIGIDIVDNPGVQVDERPKLLSDTSERSPAGHPLVEWFIRHCEEAGVEYQVRVAAGVPHLEIFSEAQRHDLI